jgi:hypothetical protein
VNVSEGDSEIETLSVSVSEIVKMSVSVSESELA